MAITCALFGPLREAAGQKHVELHLETPTTVDAVITELVAEKPALDAQVFNEDRGLRSINVTLNGSHIQHLAGLETDVEEGDIVRLAPPVRGGSKQSSRSLRQRADR